MIEGNSKEGVKTAASDSRSCQVSPNIASPTNTASPGFHL